MLIKGLQKLTLLDYPSKVACTVFTGGCNFRCPFCHNASLVTHIDSECINENEFFSFLKKRTGILEGVCISGGEPTLQPDLEQFIIRIKDMEFSVKLDTNGYRPDILKNLCNKGLVDYVAMDIKNSPEKYALTAGLDNFDFAKIEESASFLLNGDVDFEFRTTVVNEYHEECDFAQIGKWLRSDAKYFLQSFIDSGDTIKTGLNPHSDENLGIFLNTLKTYMPNAQIRG
ncbi:MAG: anaerobic ribonucleoside-triphosphate reductase activating protein [Clostridia bacterium]|nr:anaerobic ribonucleoside-triphosphate reductase activating protein [Clostridia bacterium]